MDHTTYEQDCSRAVTEAVSLALKAAASEGFREGAIISTRKGDRYRLTSVRMYLGDRFNRDGQIIAFLSMKGVKLLKSGSWGTHSHTVGHYDGLTVIGQANTAS